MAFIIASAVPLAVGQHVTAGLLSDDHGRDRKQPFVVLRVATYAEWFACIRAYTGKVPQAQPEPGDTFYEISTD